MKVIMHSDRFDFNRQAVSCFLSEDDGTHIWAFAEEFANSRPLEVVEAIRKLADDLEKRVLTTPRAGRPPTK